jgi:hypothetical protein
MDSGEEHKTGGAKVRNPIESSSISDELLVSMTVSILLSGELYDRT